MYVSNTQSCMSHDALELHIICMCVILLTCSQVSLPTLHTHACLQGAVPISVYTLCMRARKYVCTHAYMLLWTNACWSMYCVHVIHMCVQICTRIHILVWMHVMLIYAYIADACTCKHTHAKTRKYIYMYIHIYTHIYIYTHLYKPMKVRT